MSNLHNAREYMHRILFAEKCPQGFCYFSSKWFNDSHDFCNEPNHFKNIAVATVDYPKVPFRDRHSLNSSLHYTSKSIRVQIECIRSAFRVTKQNAVLYMT